MPQRPLGRVPILPKGGHDQCVLLEVNLKDGEGPGAE